MILNKKYFWIIGTLVALLGVGLVRLVAPKYPVGSAGMVIMLAGYTLVIAGLFSLTLSTRNDE